MRKLTGLLLCMVVAPACAEAPKIFAEDGTYLGNLGSRFDPESVNNPQGIYGSPHSPNSINNPHGVYGSPYSPQSPNSIYGGGILIKPACVGLGC